MPEPARFTAEKLLADDVCKSKSCCNGDDSQNNVIDVDIITENKMSMPAAVDATWQVKLLAAKERSRQGQAESGRDWTKEEETSLIEQLQQHSNNAAGRYNSIRYDWDQIANHPALEGRTLNQLKWKWKRIQIRKRRHKKQDSSMRSDITKNRDRSGRSSGRYENKPIEAYKQTSITSRNASKSQHRRHKSKWWTKDEEQPLLDLLNQNFTAHVEWEDIAKLPVLSGRTADQIKGKWKGLKSRGPTLHGTSSALWSAEEDTRVLELYECTEASSVFRKSIRVAGSFPGRTQTAVLKRCYTLRKQAAEEATKKRLIVSEPALAIDKTVQTRQSCTVEASGIHEEESTDQLDSKKLVPGGLLGRSKQARSCGDCDGVGASEHYGPDSAVYNTVSLAIKGRPHTTIYGSTHSSMHKAGSVAAAGSSTSTPAIISSNQLEPRRLAALPPSIKRPVLRRAHGTLPNSWMAPTYVTSWVSLSPKKNEEAFNANVSWPLFDDLFAQIQQHEPTKRDQTNRQNRSSTRSNQLELSSPCRDDQRLAREKNTDPFVVPTSKW
jgi:hypothetical protein